MKEIKSVRVRRTDINSGTLDIKVTIYADDHTFGADERVLVGINLASISTSTTVLEVAQLNAKVVWIETTYKKRDLYKDFTDDQFITDFIDMNARSDGGGKEYEIIQDPWENKVPIWRKYGFDPYYLNNGAQIQINWNEGNTVSGGYTYSSDTGKEINTTSLISKTHWIVGIDDPSKDQNSLLHFTKNNEIDYRKKAVDCQVYGGLVTDLYIIKDIIEAWKRKVPGYDELALCSPNNESCSIIPYKSPLKPIETEEPTKIKVAVNEPPKEKMTVVLPPDVIKVKNDITSFVIYVGKGKEKSLLENPSTEEDEFVYDDSPGIDEYTESEFIGNDEAQWAPIPDANNDVIDPDTDKGSPGPEGPDTPAAPSYVPASQTQKEFIKNAVLATLSKGSGKGVCGRFTFNHANNYVRLMQGKSVENGTPHNAGGNARESGYHKNLQSLGYKKTDYGSMSRSDLIKKIKTNGWSVGDVIAYWCTDGPSNDSHVMYGHTQIFTNAYHTNLGYRWSTDVINNFGERGGGEFIYNSKKGNTWNLIYLEAPKTKRLNDSA